MNASTIQMHVRTRRVKPLFVLLRVMDWLDLFLPEDAYRLTAWWMNRVGVVETRVGSTKRWTRAAAEWEAVTE